MDMKEVKLVKEMGRVRITHEVWCEWYPWYRYPWMRLKDLISRWLDEDMPDVGGW